MFGGARGKRGVRSLVELVRDVGRAFELSVCVVSRNMAFLLRYPDSRVQCVA